MLVTHQLRARDECKTYNVLLGELLQLGPGLGDCPCCHGVLAICLSVDTSELGHLRSDNV